MAQTDFNDNVVITGSRDIDQLKVKANTTQAQPLQTWESSSGSVLSQVTSDGRLQVGDDVGLSSPDALVEAHRAETSTAKPKRGWHSLGKVTNLVSDLITWTMSELLLLGSAGVSGLQTAFRAKLTHNNSGASTSAELRAGDFQSINQTGSSGVRVGQVTGVRGTGSNDVNAYVAKAIGVEATVTNASGGNVTDAVGFEVVAPTNSGTIANLHGLRVPDLTAGAVNYAIKTGLGSVSFGDFLEVKRPSSVPGVPATDFVRVYPKSDGKLYYQNWVHNSETTSGMDLLTLQTLSSAQPTISLSSIPQNYRHLKILIRGRCDIAATLGGLLLRPNGDLTAANYFSTWLACTTSNQVVALSVDQNPTQIGLMIAYGLPGGLAPANSFGVAEITLHNYSETGRMRQINYQVTNYVTGTVNVAISTGGGVWSNTANAITSVVIQTGAGNFVAGSSMVIYGVA